MKIIEYNTPIFFDNLSFDNLSFDNLSPDKMTYPDISEGIRNCNSCLLYRYVKRPVPSHFIPNSRYLVIGRNAGKIENDFGVPFYYGAPGAKVLYREYLSVLGLGRYDVNITNLVKCHTIDNAVPDRDFVFRCASLWLAKEFDSLYQPVDYIILLGESVVNSFFPGLPMSDAVRSCFLARISGRMRYVFSWYHPGNYLRSSTEHRILCRRIVLNTFNFIRDLQGLNESSNPL